MFKSEWRLHGRHLLATCVMLTAAWPVHAEDRAGILQACCFPDGVCWDLLPGECTHLGGSPQGPGTDCAAVACPVNAKLWQPPVFGEPSNVYYGWNQHSEYWVGPMVADDWICSSDVPVGGVRWWGSFANWHEGWLPPDPPTHFHIVIWTNISAGPIDPFPHPGEVLYETSTESFTAEFAGWDFDPRSTSYEACFVFEIALDPTYYFYQPAGNHVFWVTIAACYNPMVEHPFGWKTRPQAAQPVVTGAAVVVTAPQRPMVGQWYESGYPLYWPDATSGWDMAFELLPPGPTQPKWSQPPAPYVPSDAYNAWDEDSMYGSEQIVADDWRCLTSAPVTGFTFWGSWGSYDPWPWQLPDWFRIAMWSNWIDITDFCHPYQVLWEKTCPNYTWEFVGWEFPPYWLWPPPPPTSVFKFTVDLAPTDWFWQPPGENIYWVSIAGVYNAGIIDPYHAWGWVTRPCHGPPPEDNVAVRIYDPTAPVLGSEWVNGYPIYGGLFPPWDADLALEVKTQPVVVGDRVVCEPQGGPPNNPYHPPTYWYDMAAYHPWGRCDFHVRVYDPNPSHYTNVVAPPTWEFRVHQAGGEWWASWWDPDCSNPAVQFRFQFDNPNPSDWGHWRTTESSSPDPNAGVADFSERHDIEPDGYGYRVHVPRPAGDTVICEPQGVFFNPLHPPTYWYDVTPDFAHRCDFHVRVYDPNPMSYTNIEMPPTWQFLVHQLDNGEWWASWWDPDCSDPVQAGQTFRFQFDNPNTSVWSHWRTTMGGHSDPYLAVMDQSENHADEPDGHGYRVHVPTTVQACCFADTGCVDLPVPDCLAQGGVPEGPGTVCPPPGIAYCDAMKWVQPPGMNAQSPQAGCFYGWDEYSHYDCCQVLAANWVCSDQRPVTDIHWWGSYVGWIEPYPPPEGPDLFHVAIWTNEWGAPGDPAHPGMVIWEAMIPRIALNERAVGCDYHPYYGSETTFRYDFEIPRDQWFWQGPATTVYWVSIAANYGHPPGWGWGWKTREALFSDPGMVITDPRAPHLGSPFVAGHQLTDPEGNPWDLAFVLTTLEAEPPRDVVVCEPQGAVNNPRHPPTYWYDVTPDGALGRCDFHVHVFDPDGMHYANIVLPPTWEFMVHEVRPGEWWASWWDPDCSDAIQPGDTFRFQFDNPHPAAWGDWTTTIGASSDPYLAVMDQAQNHPLEPPGWGYQVHVPRPGSYPKCTRQPTENPEFPGFFYGWNEPSRWMGPQYVADDWLCNDARPVSDLHWWGSYLNWMELVPPPSGPCCFQIGLWTDVPAGPDQPFSHPGQMFWEWWVMRDVLNEHSVGMDYHPEHGMETCFRYDFTIPPEAWWYQPNLQGETVYWVSIAAEYDWPPPPEFAWGWKTRQPRWNDAAVRIFAPVSPQIGQWYEQGEPLYNGEGAWDMAFIITSALPPEICRGDVNCDDVIDFNDINPFVAALSDWAGYRNAYPCCPEENPDCNRDGVVDFDDINLFVWYLSSGQTCPNP